MARSFGETFSTEQDTQKGKFLTFLLGKEVYAIEIKLVTEIICLQPITGLPEVPGYIKGIVNIRGKIIPVMDIRLRLKLEPIEYSRKTCIVIIEVNNVSVGLIVDNVSEVISIADENIVSPPEIKNGSENRFVKAIGVSGENVKLILDCEKIVNENDIEEIKQKS
jgi:purine-binding chemotaxis protein CheW